MSEPKKPKEKRIVKKAPTYFPQDISLLSDETWACLDRADKGSVELIKLHSFANGGSVPADKKKLARVAECSLKELESLLEAWPMLKMVPTGENRLCIPDHYNYYMDLVEDMEEKSTAAKERVKKRWNKVIPAVLPSVLQDVLPAALLDKSRSRVELEKEVDGKEIKRPAVSKTESLTHPHDLPRSPESAGCFTADLFKEDTTLTPEDTLASWESFRDYLVAQNPDHRKIGGWSDDEALNLLNSYAALDRHWEYKYSLALVYIEFNPDRTRYHASAKKKKAFTVSFDYLFANDGQILNEYAAKQAYKNGDWAGPKPGKDVITWNHPGFKHPLKDRSLYNQSEQSKAPEGAGELPQGHFLFLGVQYPDFDSLFEAEVTHGHSIITDSKGKIFQNTEELARSLA